MVPRQQSHGQATFIPILIANLFPLVELIFLDWQIQNVLFIYWIEIGLHVLIYSGLVLFAGREPKPEGRTIDPVTLSVPFLTTNSDSIQPVDWMPPIYGRNVRYAAGLLVWGLGFWACLSVLMIVLPSSESLELPAGSTAIPIEEYISVISDAYSPEILGNALVLGVSQLLAIRREFFGQQKYEQLSAPMTAEIPVRKVVFWILLTGIAIFVFPIASLPLVAVFDTTTITQIGTAMIVVLGKLTIEWSAFQAQQLEEPKGVARWFTPEKLPV